ncbi:MAG: cyclic pyranopterin monophosphate synthase MoaC [Planctomycetes bacterium]|jgi:cyclic pyranopterin phosphate synthase|nr:cyclic pyranopterin monophosphate synthase MoaC [Planctomycetota bacterium]
MAQQSSQLSHLDARGHASMVDVADKKVTRRRAAAECLVSMNANTLAAILEGGVPKGDVLSVARIAGIQAAKRTPELIPLCHGLNLTSIKVDFEISARHNCVAIFALATALDRTGVEMEALTAAAVAALTIYDMCKALQKDMTITGLKLVAKSGGKSGLFKRGRA